MARIWLKFLAQCRYDYLDVVGLGLGRHLLTGPMMGLLTALCSPLSLICVV